MKLSIVIALLISCIVCFHCSGQDKQPQYKNQPNIDTTIREHGFVYSLKTAHPHAQALMKEDFYWSPIEETGPFGSDDGWEAAQGFRQWRVSNKSVSPVNYLKELIAGWNYPYFDWREMDTTKIKAFIVSRANVDEASIQQQIQQLKTILANSPATSQRHVDDAQLRQVILSSAQDMGGVFLLGQDNAIIGTGFAQLALEGKVDRELKVLTATAIKRQLLPVLINRYGDDYRDMRKEQLTKMLDVINKAR